jgi:hypothetical protein
MLDFITKVIAAILVFGFIVIKCSDIQEQQTYESLTSGIITNPSPYPLGTQQTSFQNAIIDDMITAFKTYETIEEMPDKTSQEDEKVLRAKKAIYQQREDLWKELTTKKFIDYKGFISRIDSETISGKRYLELHITLFDSGIVFQEQVRIDDVPGSWFTIHNIDWIDLNVDDAVKVSGEYSQWHCCVSSADWPSFGVKLTKIEKL